LTNVTGEESGLPNAARFVKDFLRGSTYTFATAIADLIDNSIEAKATQIDLIVDLQSFEVILMDNGNGMGDSEHHESMKVAAETREYTSTDLGKYGTGMKAASLSQAKRLIVATRAKGSTSCTVRCLDVDHVVRTNDWARVTQVLSVNSLPMTVQNHLQKTQGTAIIWQNLDRVFGDRELSVEKKQSELIAMAELTEQHVSLVFHKFLTGEVKGYSKVNITLNGNALTPWDPFARQEKTILIAEKDVVIGSQGGKASVKTYLLPGDKEWSSPEAKAISSGPKTFNNAQGFYVYRNGRLIIGGGWQRFRSIEPHVSLARISLEFDSSVDHILKVPVDKSSITIPQTTRTLLAALVAEICKKADERYRKQKQLENTGLPKLPGRNTSTPVVTRRITAAAVIDAIEKVAKSQALEVELAAIKQAIRAEAPSVADEVGW
jgi:hypothetical protein